RTTCTRQMDVEPNFVAGLDMARFFEENKTKRESCAMGAVKSRKNALLNPRAVYGANLTKEEVLNSHNGMAPLSELEISTPSDASIVLVLASAEKARKFAKSRTVWINGIGWSCDTPWIEDRDLSRAAYAEQSASRAYKRAWVR